MRPVRPRSSSICLRSVSKLCTSCPSTVTENSIPILRSEPPRNFGSTFVPSRFQISGGTSPEIRNVRLLAEAPAQAGIPAVGVGSGCGSGPRPGAGSPRPPTGVGSGLVFCSKIIITFVQFYVTLSLVNPKMEDSEYESTQTETYNIGERSKTT